jgi:hypothetical protein
MITHLAPRRLNEPDASGRPHNVEPAIGVPFRPRRGHPVGDGVSLQLQILTLPPTTPSPATT